MPLSLSGTLRDPLDNALAGATVTFRARTTSEYVLQGVSAETVTDAQGAYTLSVAFGRYDLYVQPDSVPYQRIALARDIAITSETTATSLNALIADQQAAAEATPQIVLDMQAVAAETRGYRDGAAASASAAAASEAAANQRRIDAEAARDSAQQAKAGSETARDDAQAAAQEAEQDASAVATNRTDVEASASQAASDAADATAAKTAAEAARDDAVNIAGGDSQPIFDAWVVDVERRQLEAATGGLCTIVRTPAGQPSYYFVLPRINWEDIDATTFGTGTMEAFLVNGAAKGERLIAMFPAAMVNGEIVSQPGREARNARTWDEAVSECTANGSGHSLMTVWDWAAVSMWCMANGYQPRGNTDNGPSHSHPHERGVLTTNNHTLTGSGPNSWNHNAAANGIADLVGNYWEWLWGMKMQDGEVILAPDNDTSLVESSWVSQGVWLSSSNGGEWLDVEGDVVRDGPIGDDSNGDSASETWSSLGVPTSHQLLRRALLEPNALLDPEGRCYWRNYGERFPRRGGIRRDGSSAGLGALNLGSVRDNRNSIYSFRPAFSAL